jgi:cytidylate kinase
MRTPRSVDAIVDEQVQRWLMQRSKEPARTDQSPPIIAISRQLGAHGGDLAQRVADRLGFSCWNRQLLAEMARHAHADEQALAAFDEHHRAVLTDTLSGIMPKAAIGPSDYFRELHHVVHTIARHGKAVVVGRGVQFMLDPAHVLRVRVVCPVDQRVREVMGTKGLDEKAARAAVDEADVERREFMNDHYGRNIDDPCAYDLWINTGSVTLDAGAEIVVAAFRARFATAARGAAAL